MKEWRSECGEIALVIHAFLASRRTILVAAWRLSRNPDCSKSGPETRSPGSDQVRKVLGASWTIAEQVNSLRNLMGTGHGRTLPTALSAEAALLVVREACSLAQFVLDTLDRQLGR